MTKTFFLLLFSIACQIAYSQVTEDILVLQTSSNEDKKRNEYFYLNTKGDTVINLNPEKYRLAFTDTFRNFAVISFLNKQGWWAIDRKEKVLFEVFNWCLTEVCPDELENGMIRMIDKERKIGFANEKGEIVIQPQFEYISSFRNGKAIFRKNCKQVPLMEDRKVDLEHIDLVCETYGYIDEKGNIKAEGNYTFDELAKKIGWW
jgi:hypothetical protein